MKIKYVFALALFSIALIFQACTSGKKSYEKGDYFDAVVKSVNRLRKNPDHKKSLTVLKSSYPQALLYYNARVNNIQASNQPFKNAEILEIYFRLNNLYEEIQRSPGALSVVPNPKNYFDEVKVLTPLAAEEYYQSGMALLAESNRQSAMRAHQDFVRAERYVPGYKDVHYRMEEALEMATLKVMVRQFMPPSVAYALSIDFFQDQIYGFLFHYQDNQFVRFMSENDFTDSLSRPDQILEIMFDDFVVGQTNNYKETREFKKDSVIVATTKSREGDVPIYGTVKADYTENRREVISNGLLSMRVIDAYNNQVIMHDKFPGEFVWISKWASFNGDERALSEEQVNVTKLEPMQPPPPQQLFIEFCRPIFSQIQAKVRSYYQNI